MKPPADIVIRGGPIYTAEPHCPFATTLAIKDGRIAYIGTEDGATDWIGTGTEIINGADRLVIPGFRDAHLHPINGGLSWVECPLAGEDTAAACVEKIAVYESSDLNKPVIRGNGWRQGLFPPAGPHKSLLDKIIPDRPVYLTALDGHSAWVNSCALRLAGVDGHTPDPPGGKIERDQETGAPTGTLREWPAMNLVQSCLPPPHHDDLLGAMEVFMEMAARAGIVAVHEAAAKREELEIYQRLAQERRLSVEIGASLLCEPEAGLDQIERLIALRECYGSELLRPFSAKIFLDGVIESRTAFLSQPYAYQPENRGATVWDPAEFSAMATALDRQGFSLHIHTVGDGAISLALAALAAARQKNGRHDRRHQLTHLDLLKLNDMNRLRDLDAIANMQPAWFYADESFREAILPALGRGRSNRLYRLYTMLSRGVRVCLSSDWPYSGGVSTFKPLEAIQVGLTRKSLIGKERHAFRPAERVELSKLIDGFTIHSAFASFRDHETGSLRAGKLADLAVLDRNLFAIPPEEVSQSRVLLTLFRGQAVHRDI